MTDRPLIFDSESMRKNTSGMKSETRRIGERFRKWKVGDTFWAREAFQYCLTLIGNRREEKLRFRADDAPSMYGSGKPRPWCSPLFLWKKWARFRAEIIGIHWEPVQSITEEGALAEGFPRNTICGPRLWFAIRWGELHGHKGPHCWDANPEVCVIRYRPLSLVRSPEKSFELTGDECATAMPTGINLPPLDIASTPKFNPVNFDGPVMVRGEIPRQALHVEP